MLKLNIELFTGFYVRLKEENLTEALENEGRVCSGGVDACVMFKKMNRNQSTKKSQERIG